MARSVTRAEFSQVVEAMLPGPVGSEPPPYPTVRVTQWRGAEVTITSTRPKTASILPAGTWVDVEIDLGEAVPKDGMVHTYLPVLGLVDESPATGQSVIHVALPIVEVS